MREIPRETRHERGVRGCSAGIERYSRSRCSSEKRSVAKRGRRSDRGGMPRAAIVQFFVETTAYRRGRESVLKGLGQRPHWLQHRRRIMTEAKLTWSIWQALLHAFAWAFTRRGFHRFAEWITAMALNVE